MRHSANFSCGGKYGVSLAWSRTLDDDAALFLIASSGRGFARQRGSDWASGVVAPTQCRLCAGVRDHTEEQSSQCGFHPHVHTFTPQGQHNGPSMSFGGCSRAQTSLWSLSGRIPPLFDIRNHHFQAELEGENLQTDCFGPRNLVALIGLLKLRHLKAKIFETHKKPSEGNRGLGGLKTNIWIPKRNIWRYAIWAIRGIYFDFNESRTWPWQLPSHRTGSSYGRKLNKDSRNPPSATAQRRTVDRIWLRVQRLRRDEGGDNEGAPVDCFFSGYSQKVYRSDLTSSNGVCQAENLPVYGVARRSGWRVTVTLNLVASGK